jgi:hypothetical protein
MSINYFTNKIKEKLNIDTFTIMCLFIIVGVGIASFGLGRLSVLYNETPVENEVKILSDKEQIGLQKELDPIYSSVNKEENESREKMYVASKNGKLYYSLGCSGAKRISEKNMIWFATSSEAEKSGYTKSSSCK